MAGKLSKEERQKRVIASRRRLDMTVKQFAERIVSGDWVSLGEEVSESGDVTNLTAQFHADTVWLFGNMLDFKKRMDAALAVAIATGNEAVTGLKPHRAVSEKSGDEVTDLAELLI